MKRRKRTRLEAIIERLHHSRNPHEKMATYLGLTHHHGIPVLHDNSLQLENIHVVGSPGSGKTSRAVQAIALQRIAAGQGAVIIIDGKGDVGLFNSIREAAFYQGRRFKFFTNRTDLPGYGFNPWDPRLITQLTLVDILGLITNALNIYHGDDYGQRLVQRDRTRAIGPGRARESAGRRKKARVLARRLQGPLSESRPHPVVSRPEQHHASPDQR